MALQALAAPDDRAVVTSTRNMLRALGSAVGVALSTAIQYAVMESSLPSALPVEIRTQVINGSWAIGEAASEEWQESILEAKMQGIHVVFIIFAPLMGLCLLGCLVVKDKILTSDPKEMVVEHQAEVNSLPLIQSGEEGQSTVLEDHVEMITVQPKVD